jgi:hypothetical protein
MARLGVAQAEALMRRFGLTQEHLVGIRFAINVAIATTIVWARCEPRRSHPELPSRRWWRRRPQRQKRAGCSGRA